MSTETNETTDISWAEVLSVLDRFWHQTARDRQELLQYRNYPPPSAGAAVQAAYHAVARLGWTVFAGAGRLDRAETLSVLNELAVRYGTSVEVPAVGIYITPGQIASITVTKGGQDHKRIVTRSRGLWLDAAWNMWWSDEQVRDVVLMTVSEPTKSDA